VLKQGTLLLAGSLLFRESWLWAEEPQERPALRLGLVTDPHYADKPPAGNRYFRESLGKVAEAAKRLQADKPDLTVSLGDLVDSAASLEAEKAALRRVVHELAALAGPHHYVLGNHCVENLTKPEFLAIVGQARSFDSFDAGGYHFVILDSCFRSDGAPYGRKNFRWGDAQVPPAEREWLRADLQQTPHKTIVLAHQCLDLPAPMGVTNASQVREILEESGKVLAVIQGHFHYGNYQELGDVHYCTLSAIVEGTGAKNNSYALLDLLPGDAIRITGFCKQKSYHWQPQPQPV
jgi:alkaline phosphatase